MMKSFVDLGISERWAGSLSAMGIQNPMPVQRESIPMSLEGHNLVVQAPTGSGKTLAYLLPMVERLNLENRFLEGLVLLPSRELAVQVRQVAERLAGSGFSVASLIGGAGMLRQLETLKKKPKLAVGTPGRVLDLFEKGKLNGQEIRAVVIDEADKMFSQGFGGPIRDILKKTLKTRRLSFFSASVTRETLEMAETFLEKWTFLDLMDKSRIPAAIRHEFFVCASGGRNDLLNQILRIYGPGRTMLFVRSPEGVEAVAAQLRKDGQKAEGLHALLPQMERRQMLDRFREGRTGVLVTTDFLARGMDIQDVDLIVNFDVPEDALHYQHRAGRTGRAGKAGVVATLVREDQKFIMAKFARELKIHILPMAAGPDRVYPLNYRGKK
ncbi:MAG: DEAD/DEAH box helicase [Peptococcaceae bacterium]|jgi:superfamily II DNA/RNA helicase|nr:DEAD/DEAH box helicase [Peptococcaceae bacterium]